MKNQRGFSLIEIMIALAILSGMSVAIWGLFYQISNQKKNSAKQADRYRSARLTLERIEKDLSMAFLSKNQLPTTGISSSSALSSPASRFPRTFFIAKKKKNIDEVAFSYVGHRVFSPDARESDTAVVFYYGGDEFEESGTFQLLRAETKRLDSKSVDELHKTIEPLCDRVLRLELLYYDAQQSKWFDKWVSNQMGISYDRLPSAIKIKMIFIDEFDNELILESMVRLLLPEPVENQQK